MYEALCLLVREWDGNWPKLKAMAQMLGLGHETRLHSGESWVSYEFPDGSDIYLFQMNRGCVVQWRHFLGRNTMDWAPVYKFMERVPLDKSAGRFLEINEPRSTLLACHCPAEL